MDDRSELLNRLGIPRETHQAKATRWRGWTAVAGAVTLAAGISLWFAIAGPSGVPVQAAIARPLQNIVGNAVGSSSLDASGYVVARRQATVSAKITGKVTEVFVEEGQRVEKGQVIAHLDDSNAVASLGQAEAELAEVRARLAAAKSSLADIAPIYEREKSLATAGWISRTTFDNIRLSYDQARTNTAIAERSIAVAVQRVAVAQASEEDTIIRSPFSGVITVKAAQPGEVVSPLSTGGFTRTGIGTIVDMESLEVDVDVSENFINRVHRDQDAVITPNAYQDARIPGFILAVVPTADRSKATIRVRVGFRKADPRLVPEMGARVSFLDRPTRTTDSSTAPQPAAVVVPVEAVQSDGETGFVFVIHGSTVERRSVKLGGRTHDGQTVVAGLLPNTVIAIGDFSRLSDGAKIEVRER